LTSQFDRDDRCFLCVPDDNLVYARRGAFYAMLGLGPVVVGYSLIATTQHLPSMFDLDDETASELVEFTESVRSILRTHFSNCIVTEHGRVPVCEERDEGGHESHCFHAHRLVFPAELDLTHELENYGLRIEHYSDFSVARGSSLAGHEYLYFEKPDGSCVVCYAQRRLFRQFFRFVVSDLVGRPDRADWRVRPGYERINEARKAIFGGEGALDDGHQEKG